MELDELDQKVAEKLSIFFAAYDKSDAAAQRALIEMKLTQLYEALLYRKSTIQPAPAKLGGPTDALLERLIDALTFVAAGGYTDISQAFNALLDRLDGDK